MLGCVWLLLAQRMLLVDSQREGFFKAISYAPSPLKAQATLKNDDFMAKSARDQWSYAYGRGDLAIIKKLGANAVRLYGNDPSANHTAFLDEAQQQGLMVIPGLSDFPYIQSEDNCKTTGFICYRQIKDQYLKILQSGFLDDLGNYHPTLKQIIVMNEPELKMPNIDQPFTWTRALISAIDAMVDAEKEFGVLGPLPNFSVTFSFGICAACIGGDGMALGRNTQPAIGQMLELRRAMLHPAAWNYSAKNDLAHIYKTRFTNSFNTNNGASELEALFLDAYEAHFPDVPVFIGEYHATGVNILGDLRALLDICSRKPVIVGVSFFEFEVRYDKGGSETAYGIFGLGDQTFLTMKHFFGHSYPVWCLTEIPDPEAAQSLPEEVAMAFGGDFEIKNLICQ